MTDRFGPDLIDSEKMADLIFARAREAAAGDDRGAASAGLQQVLELGTPIQVARARVELARLAAGEEDTTSAEELLRQAEMTARQALDATLLLELAAAWHRIGHPSCSERTYDCLLEALQAPGRLSVEQASGDRIASQDKPWTPHERFLMAFSYYQRGRLALERSELGTAAAYFQSAFDMRDAEVAPFAALALACEIGRSGYADDEDTAAGPDQGDAEEDAGPALRPQYVEWLLEQAVEYDHPEASPEAALSLGELLKRRRRHKTARRFLVLARDSGHPVWAPRAAEHLDVIGDESRDPDPPRDPEVIEPMSFVRSVLIVGAGTGGQYLFASLQRGTVARRYRVIGFLDDDPYPDGIPFVPDKRVLGPISDLPAVVRREKPDAVWMAAPRAPLSKRRQVAELCDQARIPLKMLPSMHELVLKAPLFPQLREMRIEDLVGEERLEAHLDAAWWLGARRVMIVGGGGALGAALARKLSDVGADRIVLVDRDPHALRVIEHELKHVRQYDSLHVHQGSAVAGELLHDILRRHSCETMFFAVTGWASATVEPERQRHIFQGLMKLMRLLPDVPLLQRFIWISDANIALPTTGGRALGALLEALAVGQPEFDKGPIRCAVRVPHLYTATGSVLADLKRQIEVGGPLRVPASSVKQRYMHAYHAADLVLRAAEAARHQEVLGIDCGQEVAFPDIAARMVRLRGLEPREDILIEEDPLAMADAPSPVGDPTGTPGVRSLGTPYANLDIRAHQATLLGREANKLIALAQRYCGDPSAVVSTHLTPR